MDLFTFSISLLSLSQSQPLSLYSRARYLSSHPVSPSLHPWHRATSEVFFSWEGVLARTDFSLCLSQRGGSESVLEYSLQIKAIRERMYLSFVSLPSLQCVGGDMHPNTAMICVSWSLSLELRPCLPGIEGNQTANDSKAAWGTSHCPGIVLHPAAYNVHVMTRQTMLTRICYFSFAFYPTSVGAS